MDSFNQQSLVDFEGYEDPTVDLNSVDDDLPNFGEEYQDDLQDPNPDDRDLNEDYLTKFLKMNNVNRNEILFTNENGEEEAISFDELSDDEKIGVLSSLYEIPITDQELETLNFLRRNRLNLAEFVEGQKQKAIEDYLSQNKSYNYSVDQLTDDELYAFELKDKYPELTDEEILEEVSQAKENQELFAKKINSLRNEYKKLEEEQLEQQNQQNALAKEQEWEDFATNIVDVAKNTNELHDLLLEDEDKEDVLSFLLDKDGNGQTKFYKLLEDPNMLFKMAWYAIKGEDAFKQMQEYYRNEITKSRRQSSVSNTRTVRKTPTVTSADTFDLDSYFKK